MAVKTLHVIVTGAPPAAGVSTVVGQAQADGWRVGVIATPAALRFVDVETLEKETGLPVPHDFRRPGQPEPLPPADAVLVAPATGNTLVKITRGLSDTLAAGRAVAAIGARLPVVVVPFATREHLAHPALVSAIAELRSWRVRVIDEHFPALPEEGSTGSAAGLFPWTAAWRALTASPTRTDRDEER
ncbi:flavoprotein [Lentzea pudingi]|uniref:Flavoprotein n=1 Tax=Lentzea pudingi TaxID=1789439 RepID=A0ABQ2HC84_9PSEU|nr:flavoprotein [Lentzea pudingi]GGM73484.1 flavoprotein [Lentzea pudingi]